jgi:alpha-tubulin suppressor-like RCC1 family protein
VGQGHYCVPLSNGTVTCWGNNSSGELGIGATNGSSRPVPVPGLSNVTNVAVGPLYTCALRADGSVACWGLGYGDNPVAIGGVAGAVQIAAANNQACGLLASGRVVCWSPTDAVAELDGLDSATQIAAGFTHLCAIREDGALLCWGANDFGQLGNGGDDPTIETPTRATVFSDVVEVALGLRHTCARASSGTVSCVGGLSPLAFASLEAFPVPNLANATKIAAGGSHLCALRSNGAVSCVGSSPAAGPVVASGELATLALPDRAIDVGAGIGGSCAILADSRVFCWGVNLRGELGDGGVGPDSAIPVEVIVP